MVLALLRWNLMSAERFTDLYVQYFALTELGIGRLLNLAVALPVGFALLTASWRIANPLGMVFVTLGQQSLGAFVLHVYGILLVANLPLAQFDDPWTHTLIQVDAGARDYDAVERRATVAAPPGHDVHGASTVDGCLTGRQHPLPLGSRPPRADHAARFEPHASTVPVSAAVSHFNQRGSRRHFLTSPAPGDGIPAERG